MFNVPETSSVTFVEMRLIKKLNVFFHLFNHKIWPSADDPLTTKTHVFRIIKCYLPGVKCVCTVCLPGGGQRREAAGREPSLLSEAVVHPQKRGSPLCVSVALETKERKHV